MQIKIWGARGSLPSPHTPAALESQIRTLFQEFFDKGHKKAADLPKFFEELPRHRLGGYGGNTPCIEIKSKSGQQVILDGGSGIRTLGYEMLGGPCGKGQGELHIFFTHFHWDHLIGLPFFTPIFIPGNKIHVYAVQHDLQDVFKAVFKKPYFPVALEHLASKIQYHALEPRKPFQVGDITLTPYQLDHPDPCWGFRVESGGRVYSHCVDTECTRVSRDQLGPDLPLYQGADVMVFDAQYTLMETIEKVNWGHAAASLGLDIAMREGIKRVYFMHHDPASTNEKIAAAEAQARRYYDAQLKQSTQLEKGSSSKKLYPVEWSFAFEGLTIEI
jgi:phosphoribosyl 1,2-cyclic phosphodiesterase